MTAASKTTLSILLKIIAILCILAVLGMGAFLLFFAIVCGGLDGGIVLVFGPLGIIILVGAYKLIRKIIRTGRKGKMKLDKNTEALVDYIRSAKHNNLTDQEIGVNLKNQGGWSDNEIAKAFDVLK
ncbi:hypothetical protein HOB10_01555 [Candidatus Parcubacteria bacterium]|jgi:hypothetical protein|nr:hypothetical protein [Candidatus Parcubacteria bacterium]